MFAMENILRNWYRPGPNHYPLSPYHPNTPEIGGTLVSLPSHGVRKRGDRGEEVSIPISMEGSDV